MRAELTAEAIRLTRVLRQLLPEEPEVAGLLGLLLLTEARREARVRHGQLVPLGEQDRAGWDRGLIAEGHDLVRVCLAINRPGRYQILAAINAVHTDAPTASDTDWSQVVALYDQLTRLDPSPIVALNRAVAIAELDGPKVALTLIDRLPLSGYHAWHVARADMLRRLGRTAEAKEAYDAAITPPRTPPSALTSVASASADINACTNVNSIERNRSGSARWRCSVMNAGRSIELGSTVIVVSPSVVLSQVF